MNLRVKLILVDYGYLNSINYNKKKRNTS